MSWVRLDDNFPDHPKVVGLSIPARWLYVEGLCYSARHLTDGAIPLAKARELALPRVAQELVSAGLWEKCETFFRVHDYLKYNPERSKTLEKRAVDSARKRNGNSSDSRRIPAVPSPTRPLIHTEVVVDEETLGRRNIFILYDNFMGKPSVTGAMRGVLLQAEEDYPAVCIEHCFLEAAKASSGGRSWNFVEAILKRHEREGCVEREQVARNPVGAAQARDTAAELARYNGGFAPVYVPNAGIGAGELAALDAHDDSPGLEGG